MVVQKHYVFEPSFERRIYKMQGVEQAHLNAVFTAILKAYYDFRSSTVKEALRPITRYGKKDTRGFDSGPEITICEMLRLYDEGAVVITEETGITGNRFDDFSRPSHPHTFRTVYIADPTDRSNQLKIFLSQFSEGRKIRDILHEPTSIKIWEEKFGGPACITGAASAVSCVRRGLPIFSVLVNYITQQLVVSCSIGNWTVKLPDKMPKRFDIDSVRAQGERIFFPGIDGNPKGMKKFVTFLGDVGKIGYRENFLDSNLMSMEDMKRFLHYGVPGGPLRALYLSSLQPKRHPVGFVLANGEKIGEWIHWLAFARFAKSQTDESQPALSVYEVYQDRPWTKEGVLMSTPPIYSIFQKYGGNMYIDTGNLLKMPNPSQMRGTLIITPSDNRWAIRYGSQSGYRQIKF